MTAMARAPGTWRAPLSMAALCASLLASWASVPSSRNSGACDSQIVNTSATGEPG